MSAPILALTLPCPVCRAVVGEPCAKRNGEPTKRSHRRRFAEAPCGTDGGYQRHRKAGEDACDLCRDAHRRHMAEYRQRRPEIRDKDIAHLAARREAIRRLIELHRTDFDRLYSEERSAS